MLFRSGPEFILAWKEEAAEGHGDITISQSDIDNLMRSKAAVYAAARVLMEKMEMSWDDIRNIYNYTEKYSYFISY